jgi:hypothetical protein
VKWNTARQRSADAAPPDPRWPVTARNLLTNRERFLYDLLLSMYPDHRIFVQVALSQLIDVPEGHPERTIHSRPLQATGCGLCVVSPGSQRRGGH